MRTLVSLNPFSELRRMADVMDRAFTPFDSEVTRPFQVPLDIWEKDGKIMVKAATPGMKAEDLDVTLDDSVLTISGEIRNEHEEKQNEGRVYAREFRYGRFTRSVRLPEDIDDQQIDAEMKDGFVLISVPRKQIPQSQPKKLTVRSAAPSEPKQAAIEANASKSANGTPEKAKTK